MVNDEPSEKKKANAFQLVDWLFPPLSRLIYFLGNLMAIFFTLVYNFHFRRHCFSGGFFYFFYSHGDIFQRVM